MVILMSLSYLNDRGIVIDQLVVHNIRWCKLGDVEKALVQGYCEFGTEEPL